MGWLGMFANIAGLMTSLEGERKEQLAREEEALENERLAYEAAADALERGAKDAQKVRMAGSKLVAKQRVAYAAAGVDPSVGTAADVQAETRALSELDAKTAENNAAREAWGFKTFGMKYAKQAELDAQRSKNRQRSTILGAVGKFASRYGQDEEG